MEIATPVNEYLLNGGIEKSIYNFRNPSDESISHTLAYYDGNTDSLRSTVLAIDEFPFEYCRIIYFEEILERELVQIEERVLETLKKVKKKYRSSSVKLNSIYAQLIDHFKVITQKIEEERSLQQYLLTLKAFLLRLEMTAHQILVNDKTTHACISFRPRCPDNVITDIYNLDIRDKSFIDREKTKEDVFMKVITSKNLLKLDEDAKIYLACNNQIAAYIFQQMEKFFYNLNMRSIGDSGRVYTKQEKPMTTNDLEVALYRFNKNQGGNNQIDVFFADLIKLTKKV